MSQQQTTPVRVVDTYIILLFVAVFAYVLTFFVTPGKFAHEVATNDAGEIVKVMVPDAFQYSETGPEPLPVFAEGGELGLLNLPFEGLVSGSKWGASIGVVAFILITGGAFGIILGTGAIDRALKRLILRRRNVELALVPILFIAFSLGGAIFGMGEEVIPFVLIVTPFFLTAGLNAQTALCVTYVATQVGFATSWMNPFSVSIAQGIAGLPLLSGWEYRACLWVVFTVLGALATTLYAKRIKNMALNNTLATSSTDLPDQAPTLPLADKVILMTFALGIVWIIWGVTQKGYYLPEIATQFFSIGVVIAIFAMLFRLEGFNADRAAYLFKEGAMQLLPAALVVAFAKGIVLLLGGTDAESYSVLNTLLYTTAQSLDGLGGFWATQLMLAVQSIFNFFVTSGSGQAALTMPLMAPLADLLGVTRQSAVLAFQLGDGLTNILVPTSAALMGCLGAAKVEWYTWFKFIIKPMLCLYGVSILSLSIAYWIGF